MEHPRIFCILAVLLCITLALAGCSSSKGPAPLSISQPASAAAATTTPACPDKLVWDGEWQTAWLAMAGNHDLSTAWTKYKDRPYGDVSTMTMKQTCWDVETTLNYPNVQCVATMKGTIDKNVLSGTWSAPTMCGTKSETGRKFSLTMAADNKSWLGDFYSDGQDPSVFPPNLAGRRPVK
ncbi:MULTISPECIES: hypothetical protein [unclassified Methanoregula]|uniref:hypothetical protein n=1 Tax=unclassified Methanoregula TaxID=2649730 RepID=UPI0025E29B34|nr:MULTISPECIES: hypothetical protein [unclassified Methanoregula]